MSLSSTGRQRCDERHAETTTNATSGELLNISNLSKTFAQDSGDVRVLTQISLSLRKGETLGLVGESGCGKTTVGRLILRLIEPTAGSIVFDGTDITKLSGGALKAFRRRAQIVFQDPFASLDPRATVADAVGEGLRIHGLGSGTEREAKVAKVLDMPDVKKQLEAVDFIPAASTPEEFDKILRGMLVTFDEVAKSAGLKAQ